MFASIDVFFSGHCFHLDPIVNGFIALMEKNELSG